MSFGLEWFFSILHWFHFILNGRSERGVERAEVRDSQANPKAKGGFGSGLVFGVGGMGCAASSASETWYEEGHEDGERFDERREGGELSIRKARASTTSPSPVGAADDDSFGSDGGVRMRFEDSSGGGDSEPESPVSPHTPITGYHWTQQRPCVSEPSTPTGGQHSQLK